MAGQLSIQDILGAPNLTGLIRLTESGIPNPFPDNFYTVDQQVFGNQANYFSAIGQRTTATIAAYGGAPHAAQQLSLNSVPVVLMHSYETLSLNPLVYQSLFDYGNLSRQKQGAAEVKRQVTEFKKRLSNLRIAAMVETLFTGKIGFDNNGNLLPPGAVIPANGTTITWNIPTNSGTATSGVPSNIGVAVDPLGTGTAIIGSSAGSWANPGTDINSQIIALKQASMFLTGFPIAHAFYGRGVPSLLAGNPSTQNYMARSQFGPGGAGAQYITEGEVPKGVLGLDWHPAYQSFYIDQNGSNQPLVGTNQILFTPDYSTNWLATLEGSYSVPQNPWRKLPVEGAGNAMEDMEQVFGMFAYSVPQLIPPGAMFAYGDTWIPVLKNPQVVFIPTVA